MPSDAPHEAWSRRRLLKAGGATAALIAGAGYGRARWSGRGPRPVTAERFRSRPDLFAPLVTVNYRAPDLTPGYVLLAPASGPGQLGPLIVDNTGSPVWIHPRAGVVTAGLRVQQYHGLPVLT